MSTTWSEIPVWEFCEVDTSAPAAQRFTVKIVESVEKPSVAEKQRDGPLVIRTLVSSSQKLVGYSFTFLHEPQVREFGYSLAASYGIPDSMEMLLVLGSPHLRVIRAGRDNPIYHVVLRHK